MQVQVDIGFDQLLKIVKKLPSGQLKQLKAEIEKEAKNEKSVDLETLLLNGPTATKKQLDIIARNRKAINQWLPPALKGATRLRCKAVVSYKL
jgi:hypothetical protein